MPANTLYQYPDKSASWNERDLLIFAASIGCEPNELQFSYELHPKFSAFPTYPIVLTFKHDYTTTTSFADHFSRHLTPPKDFTPGFPALNIKRVVDGERTLQIVKRLPKTSEGRQFIIRSNVIGVWDKGVGKSTIVKTSHDLVERVESAQHEMLYAHMTETAIFMSQGGWRGPNEGKPATSPAPPTDSAPDARVRHHVSPAAHLLYRLNGDYNPLHATHVEEAVVQPTPIMHGLYTWNVAARLILKTFANGEANALQSFQASFASPVRPGEVLETEMWELEDAAEGARTIRFETKVGGKVVLARGSAVLHDTDDRTRSKL
ncbi:hypothetical protein CBER1_03024 [Cercospora berteroae]|uniref:Uncharacterized protein n=1 Tax=Cercospora berteroae TaxID=357750 RepID=A0A2S6CHF5_9PEZI|nr:hypothetical protein CBER1_03024 [Cercospora berteroae]